MKHQCVFLHSKGTHWPPGDGSALEQDPPNSPSISGSQSYQLLNAVMSYAGVSYLSTQKTVPVAAVRFHYDDFSSLFFLQPLDVCIGPFVLMHHLRVAYLSKWPHNTSDSAPYIQRRRKERNKDQARFLRSFPNSVLVLQVTLQLWEVPKTESCWALCLHKLSARRGPVLTAQVVLLNKDFQVWSDFIKKKIFLLKLYRSGVNHYSAVGRVLCWREEMCSRHSTSGHGQRNKMETKILIFWTKMKLGDFFSRKKLLV